MQRKAAGQRKNPTDTARSPLGQVVFLEDAVWYGHIAVEHPEVGRAEVLETVRRPTLIRKTGQGLRSEAYYRRLRPGRYLRVIVREQYIKTAHFADILKPKEAPLWP